LPSPSRRWSMRWLVPLTAAFLVSFGAADYYMASHQQTPADVAGMDRAVTPPSSMDSDDSQLLEAVATNTPSMKATYEANLKDVNEFIRDAEASAKSNPGDEEAQQLLMEAYAQKNMIYEMAMDRSLR